MKTCYIVSEYGGEYEDRWDSIIRVYLSLESAKKAKMENEDSYKYSGVFTEDFLDKLIYEMDDYEYEHDTYFKSLEEGVLFLHPEYAGNESLMHDLHLRTAADRDYCGTMIAEYTLYE